VTPTADGSKRPPRLARRSLDFQVAGDRPTAFLPAAGGQ
jgi:hypothetical protein